MINEEIIVHEHAQHGVLADALRSVFSVMWCTDELENSISQESHGVGVAAVFLSSEEDETRWMVQRYRSRLCGTSIEFDEYFQIIGIKSEHPWGVICDYTRNMLNAVL